MYTNLSLKLITNYHLCIHCIFSSLILITILKIDGYIGGPRGQLGKILFFSKSLTSLETETMHYLLKHSTFTISRPSIHMKTNVDYEDKTIATWMTLYEKYLLFSYDARHHRIIYNNTNNTNNTNNSSSSSNGNNSNGNTNGRSRSGTSKIK